MVSSEKRGLFVFAQITGISHIKPERKIWSCLPALLIKWRHWPEPTLDQWQLRTGVKREGSWETEFSVSLLCLKAQTQQTDCCVASCRCSMYVHVHCPCPQLKYDQSSTAFLIPLKNLCIFYFFCCISLYSWRNGLYDWKWVHTDSLQRRSWYCTRLYTQIVTKVAVWRMTKREPERKVQTLPSFHTSAHLPVD